MKVKCQVCKRMIGVIKSDNGKKLAKHRTGRSKPKNLKPVCEGSGRIV